MDRVRNICNEYITKYPHRKDEIEDLRDLAIMEIENGCSEPHEIELLIGSLNEIDEEEC